MRHDAPSARAHHTPLRRRHLAALGLLFAACSFGSYETAVSFGKLNNPADAMLSLSVDGTTLWAVDWSNAAGGYEPRLKVFDPDTNTMLGSSWWNGSWGVRAISPANEAGYEGVAWVLHENGYRVRWDADLLGYSEIEAPIPTNGATAADARIYCDMDQDSSGVHFITAIDLSGGSWSSYLYREPFEGVWERIALPTLSGKCGRVSWDGPADEIAVLDDAELLRFDADTLAVGSTVDLSAVSGLLMDFAVIGGHAVVAAKTPGPAVDSLVVVDDGGVVLDTVDLGSVRATYLHILGDTVRAYWTGADTSPIKYTAGSWTLED